MDTSEGDGGGVGAAGDAGAAGGAAGAGGEGAGAPSRGRPRDARRDEAIYQATLDLLTQRGYDRTSIDAVAAHASVSKATIYRRHRDKASLVAAAVDHRAASSAPDTTALPLREALLTTLRWLAQQVSAQDSGLLGAAFAGMRSDPALAAAMQQVLQRDQAAMTRQVLARAQGDGELLAPGAGVLFAEVAPAVVVHRALFSGQACDEAFLQHLTDDVLLPLLRRGAAVPPAPARPPAAGEDGHHPRPTPTDTHQKRT